MAPQQSLSWEHGARSLEVQGSRQCWPCCGRRRGDLPGHSLFSKAFIGVLLPAAGHSGAEQKGDSCRGAGQGQEGLAAQCRELRSPEAGSRAEEHQQGLAEVCQSCAATGGWGRRGLSSWDLLPTLPAPMTSFLEREREVLRGWGNSESRTRAGHPPLSPQAPARSGGSSAGTPALGLRHPSARTLEPAQPSAQPTLVQTPLSPV